MSNIYSPRGCVFEIIAKKVYLQMTQHNGILAKVLFIACAKLAEETPLLCREIWRYFCDKKVFAKNSEALLVRRTFMRTILEEGGEIAFFAIYVNGSKSTSSSINKTLRK